MSSTENLLTAREMRLLALAWQCFDQEPKIDYQKLGSIAGYTPGSASVTIGKIKRKLKAAAENEKVGSGENETSTTTPKRKKATPSRKSTKATPGDGNGSPTKRSKKMVQSSLMQNQYEDDEEMDTKSFVKEEGADLLAGIVDVGGYMDRDLYTDD